MIVQSQNTTAVESGDKYGRREGIMRLETFIVRVLRLDSGYVAF